MNFVCFFDNIRKPMTTIQAGNLIISGHCISTHGSIVVLENYKIAFDCGIIPEKMVGKLCSCRLIFITHGHADHISALHMDKNNRVVKSAKQAEYYMPWCCVKPWIEVARNFNVLNGKSSSKSFIPFVNGIADNNTVKLNKNISIIAHKTIHRVKSLGYTVVETREKLRECFSGFSTKTLVTWKRHGVTLTYTITKPVFSYTGDTTIEGLLSQKDFLDSEVLMTECTFLDDEIDIKEAKKRGHIHLYELVQYQDKFKGILVLCHFSARYSKSQIKRLVYEQKWNKKPLLLL